jgi:hypothetical protein
MLSLMNPLLLLASLFSPALAQDVLVSEFESESVTDIAIALTLQDMFLAELERQGVKAASPEQLKANKLHPPEGCLAQPGCPKAVLTHWESPLIVFTSVRTLDSGVLSVVVRVYDAEDEKRALREIAEEIPQGQEAEFCRLAAGKIRGDLKLYKARPAGKPLPKSPYPFLAPVPPPDIDDDFDPTLLKDPPVGPVKPPVDPVKPPIDPMKPPIDPVDPVDPVKPPIDPVTPPVGATESCARSEEERKALGLSPNLYTAFCTSGKSPEAFAADRRLRGGSVGFELSAGAPIQWFERNYDVAYGVGSNGDVSSPHLIDSLVATGMSVDGGTPTVLTRAALSFHPGQAVELGLAGGLSLNQRGTAQALAVTAADGGYQGDGAEVALGGSAGYIEPFVRLYPITSGVFKPYVSGSLTVLFSPALSADSLSDLGVPSEFDGDTPYTNRPMKSVGMATGGAGVALDVSQTFSIFAEGLYSMVLPTTNSPDQCRGDKTFGLSTDLRCSQALAAAAEEEGWMTGSNLTNGTAAVLAGAQTGELFSTALRVNVGVQLRFP